MPTACGRALQENETVIAVGSGKTRIGLYIMVLYILLNSCIAKHEAREAHKHSHAIMEALDLDPEATD